MNEANGGKKMTRKEELDRMLQESFRKQQITLIEVIMAFTTVKTISKVFNRFSPVLFTRHGSACI